jgi:acyl carrier protein
MLSIREKIVNIIAKKLNKRVDEIKTEDLFEDIDIDELDKYELVLLIEEEYNIEVTDDALEAMLTIDDLIDYVSDSI